MNIIMMGLLLREYLYNFAIVFKYKFYQILNIKKKEFTL